ncbi:MAG: twin-arginine translocase TatA/TatE family subunit [Acidobacteriota bacterium]|nr:twin-arginine translocase TatA/TatE family subunit [Acidobacteriota bacterium]MDH3528102.1 twin-arginine translocase TatA/TatE family subunit [Acidobacteriota bacterium]
MFSGWEIVLVVAVLFLLFGASRLPKLAKSLGQSRRAFKEGLEEMENELKDDGEPKAIDGATEKEA